MTVMNVELLKLLASNYRSLKAFRIGSHHQVMFGPVARGASLALIEPGSLWRG